VAKQKFRNLPDLSDLAQPGAEISLRVTPKASRAALGRDGGVVRISVTVAPENGQANAAVRAILAAAMGVAPSHLTLIRGQTSRDKVFRYSGGVSRS